MWWAGATEKLSATATATVLAAWWVGALDTGMARQSAAVSGQGIFRDAASDALVREAFFDQAAKRWRLIVPDFGVLEGPFLLAALEYAGEHEGEATFALSLASAGAIGFSAI